MDSVTIWVPSLPMIAGMVSGSVVVFVLRKVFRGLKERRQQDVFDELAAEGLRLAQLNALFPSPWDEAHAELERIHDEYRQFNPLSRNFLRHWLAEQIDPLTGFLNRCKTRGIQVTTIVGDLPHLSREAVYKLASLLTFEYGERWDECLAILAPYSDVKPLDAPASMSDWQNETETEKDRVAEEKELADKKSLFQYPWNTAYEKCRETGTWEGARSWLQKWIDEQSDLPLLSVQAAEELISHVNEKKNDDEYCVSFGMLAPYLDTGYAPHHNIRDYNLEEQLPEEWFAFWKEIKDYPSRRSLFMEKQAKYGGQPPHPVFHVPLTTKQAALLARALGHGNEIRIGFYASDLVKCVAMTTEKITIDETARVAGPDGYHTEQEDRDWYEIDESTKQFGVNPCGEAV